MGRTYALSVLLVRHDCSVAHIRKSLYKSDLEVVGEFGNPFLEVVFEKVLEFASKLDTSGTTTNDNHVEKTLDFLGALVLEGGSLAAVHDPLANALSIVDLLEEARVFAHTGDTWVAMLAMLQLSPMCSTCSPKVAFSAPTPTTSRSKGTSVEEVAPLTSDSSLM